MLIVKANIDCSHEELGKLIGLHPYVLKIKNYTAAVQRIKRGDMIESLHRVCLADREMKRGRDPVLLLLNAVDPIFGDFNA